MPAANSKLGDRVKECFTLLPEYMHHDYAALKHQLQETYGTLINDRVYSAELMNRKKRTTERMLAYLNDIKRLVRRLGYRKETNTFVMFFFMDYPLNYCFIWAQCTMNPPFELLQVAMYYEEAFRRIDSVQEPPMPPVRVFNVGTM